MTLIELHGLNDYTYVDTDGIIKLLDVDADYDHAGFYDGFSVSETDTIALPWLHDYKTWFFRKNLCDISQSWDDLPF